GLICFVLAGIGALNIQAAEGDLDLTFNFDGRVITDVTGLQDVAHGIAIDSHGRIIVAGDANNCQSLLSLVRYNPDGSLDTTFGVGGKIPSVGDALCVAVDRNDRVLIGGYQWNGSDYDMAVTRYNEDGTLDLTFGTNGTAVTHHPGSLELVTKIAVDSNDRIVA